MFLSGERRGVEKLGVLRSEVGKHDLQDYVIFDQS